MRFAATAAMALGLATVLAGCADTPGKLDRSALDFPVVSSLNGVTSATGNLSLEGRNGVVVSPDAPNAAVAVGLASPFRLPGAIQSCRASCRNGLDVPGDVVAEADLVGLGNVSLNTLGPDRTSAVFFYDHGNVTGQYFGWNDRTDRFELSRDIDALGNVTARHHVGTVTTIVVQAPGPTAVDVATAALEGNEATVFLRGSAHLENGTARIAFPIEFRVLVGQGPLTVQVTPTSAGAPLFVSEKGPDHITVSALGIAPLDETFDYFVQATRAASEDFRSVSG